MTFVCSAVGCLTIGAYWMGAEAHHGDGKGRSLKWKDYSMNLPLPCIPVPLTSAPSVPHLESLLFSLTAYGDDMLIGAHDAAHFDADFDVSFTHHV